MAGPDPFEMDAVIAWVDGSDPAWAARKSDRLGMARNVNAAPTRFASNGEITWTVASILRFAPFIRTIHILTDRQDPQVSEPLRAIFGDEAVAKIRVVDHRDAFHGHLDLLPTFNSVTIANVLHRLPDLAEHFIYFNDDTLLVRPVTPSEFFLNGAPVLRGRTGLNLKHQWRLAAKHRHAARAPETAGKIETKFRELQVAAARLAGRRFLHWKIDHTPHACRKATMSWFEATHPAQFRVNISHRIRHFSQISALALAANLEILSGNRNTRPGEVAYIFLRDAKDPARKLQKRLARASRRNYPFACVQSLDLVPPEALARVKAWLDNLLLSPLGHGPADQPADHPADTAVSGGRRPGQSTA